MDNEIKKLPVLASYTTFALPYVNHSMQLSSTYDLNLIDQLKVGDKFIFGKSIFLKGYSKLTASVLPGVRPRAVLCEILSIEKGNVFTVINISGLAIVDVSNFEIADNNVVLAAYNEVDIQDDIGDYRKYGLMADIEKSYNNVRSSNKKLPEFVHLDGLRIDEMPFIIGEFLNISTEKKYDLVKTNSSADRFTILLKEMEGFTNNPSVDSEIERKLSQSLERNQREFILRERQKQIKDLLKDFDGDSDAIYTDKITQHPEQFPEEVIQVVNTEINRLKGVPGASQEANLIKTYLDLVINLPYKVSTKDNDDISAVKKVLDEDHYGLEKQKDRILQYLAVKQLTNSLKAPIICLYGPPGVGKTSLAISIARALNRKFQKIALGGVHDESEIRGHRRTYLGALPGKIISALNKAGVNNPVILLDEIDKLQDGGYHGDPSSALLEVLDPEQNYRFEDNYLGFPFDLSQVLFICTANDIYDIPAPLRDRLELIPLYTYSLIEKIHIAKGYLIELEYQANGLSKDLIEFSDEALSYIIECYTREAGVRSLRRQIATIMRKYAIKYLESGKTLGKMIVTPKDVTEFLGIKKNYHGGKSKFSQVGVVNGLAFTTAGGDVLPIEVNTFSGKGDLIRTGSLGDVMKEACTTAFTFIKSNCDKFGIDPKWFETNDIHIHFPDTSTPKDGPSAGIATTLALLSAIKKLKVRHDVAMTGEIDLRGNATIIGGLREKTLGALREGVKVVLVPKENHEDVLELPKEVLDNIKIVEVETFFDIIPYVFETNYSILTIEDEKIAGEITENGSENVKSEEKPTKETTTSITKKPRKSSTTKSTTSTTKKGTKVSK